MIALRYRFTTLLLFFTAVKIVIDFSWMYFHATSGRVVNVDDFLAVAAVYDLVSLLFRVDDSQRAQSA